MTYINMGVKVKVLIYGGLEFVFIFFIQPNKSAFFLFVYGLGLVKNIYRVDLVLCSRENNETQSSYFCLMLRITGLDTF